MHSLGFWHEHQRGDRDEFVQLNREACNLTDASWAANFDKVPWHDSEHPYDYNSVMHYR